jgi:hypothetical protein
VDEERSRTTCWIDVRFRTPAPMPTCATSEVRRPKTFTVAAVESECFAARYRTWTLRLGCFDHRVEWQWSLDPCYRPTLYAPRDDGERNGEVSAREALDA